MISLKKFNCLTLQVLSIILENDEIPSDANGILINSEITYIKFLAQDVMLYATLSSVLNTNMSTVQLL